MHKARGDELGYGSSIFTGLCPNGQARASMAVAMDCGTKDAGCEVGIPLSSDGNTPFCGSGRTGSARVN